MADLLICFCENQIAGSFLQKEIQVCKNIPVKARSWKNIWEQKSSLLKERSEWFPCLLLFNIDCCYFKTLCTGPVHWYWYTCAVFLDCLRSLKTWTTIFARVLTKTGMLTHICVYVCVCQFKQVLKEKSIFARQVLSNKALFTRYHQWSLKK